MFAAEVGSTRMDEGSHVGSVMDLLVEETLDLAISNRALIDDAKPLLSLTSTFGGGRRTLPSTTIKTHPPPLSTAITMGVAFDHAPERPENIQTILNGLDRYNPETTTIFQDYVMTQCENKTYDCYANLALLKLCVSPLCSLPHDEPISTETRQ
jgi:hypothetical protein